MGVCAATRGVNWALLRTDDLVAHLNYRAGDGGWEKRGRRAAAGGGPPRPHDAASADAVRRAVKRLAGLGVGYAFDRVGGAEVVRSVPGELSRDAGMVAGLAAGRGRVVAAEAVAAATGWGGERPATALGAAVDGGFAWVDKAGREQSYWFLGLTRGGGGAGS